MKDSLPETTNLSISEIRDWRQFEDLVAAYFRGLVDYPGNNIADVDVKPSGDGADGGRDIIVDLLISDDIKTFKRTWIVQCKFHTRPISPAEINEINIPSLIHSYRGDGYLLICSSRPTSGITNLFERLNEKCKDGYLYECWNGTQFLKKLLYREDIHSLFFPNYFRYVETKKEPKR